MPAISTIFVITREKVNREPFQPFHHERNHGDRLHHHNNNYYDYYDYVQQCIWVISSILRAIQVHKLVGCICINWMVGDGW